MKHINFSESIPIKGSYDVIIAGGGVAGVAAAVAVARAKKRVLLIEKSIMLGGLATLGRINMYEPLCNGRGSHILRGMAEEFLKLSIRYGYDTLPAEWAKGEPAAPVKPRYWTRFSPAIFALTMTELICDHGIDLLYDSVVSMPIMKNGHCEGVIVDGKSGREFYEAGVVIDTTGDADVLHRAGVPTVQGYNYFTYISHGVTIESCKKAAASGRIQDADIGFSGGHASLYGHNHPEGMKRFEGTTAQSVTEFVVMNQRVLLDKIKKSDRGTREIFALPGMAQFRTTRRIDGEYTLLETDHYRHFEDSVGAISDFDRRDFLYEVPYRCLIRNGYDNLITAGRSASGDGYGWDVLRVIPVAVLTGQAAGEAAVLSLASGKSITDIDIAALQRSMTGTGVLLHFDDRLIPSAGSAVEATEDVGHL
ncbi:MAG: FAD-dependent oxidoreductase [Spirochaetes bacterium]|nr:FAD-dependent oxidoreductase [Spirochaetota bacterium]